MRPGSGGRVAIQGERGAFSEEAAVRLLGESVEIVPCATFESLYRALVDGRADHLLAPVENSLIGTIQRSQDLLLDSGLSIGGEVILRIAHCLIGPAGAREEQVRAVQSHPAALAQCERFFAERPALGRAAAEDTAGSVREVVAAADPARAAIAGRYAAEHHGGRILREHLEDHPENFTRFLLLGAASAPDPRADKLSLLLHLRHRPGALAAALEPLARRGIDLLRIESRPVAGQPWQYRFFLDLRAEPDSDATREALRGLRERADDVRLLGFYRAWTPAEAPRVAVPA